MKSTKILLWFKINIRGGPFRGALELAISKPKQKKGFSNKENEVGFNSDQNDTSEIDIWVIFERAMLFTYMLYRPGKLKNLR